MSLANKLVKAVLEGESARDWLRARNYGKKAQEEEEFTIGFSINVLGEDHDNVAERLRELGHVEPYSRELIARLATDSERLEQNLERLLNANGIDTRNEGHDEYGLTGSAWIKPGTPGWELVKRWHQEDGGNDGGLLTFIDKIDHVLAGSARSLWAGVSAIGRRVLDARIDFFALDEVIPYFDDE